MRAKPSEKEREADTADNESKKKKIQNSKKARKRYGPPTRRKGLAGGWSGPSAKDFRTAESRKWIKYKTKKSEEKWWGCYCRKEQTRDVCRRAKSTSNVNLIGRAWITLSPGVSEKRYAAKSVRYLNYFSRTTLCAQYRISRRISNEVVHSAWALA